jgi:cysteine-rich repeat protein
VGAQAPQVPPSLIVSFYVCGDGVVDQWEACDDGNNSGGDGCSPACNVEPGWTCTGTPSVCTRDACTPDKTPPSVTLNGGLTTIVECKAAFTRSRRDGQ